MIIWCQPQLVFDQKPSSSGTQGSVSAFPLKKEPDASTTVVIKKEDSTSSEGSGILCPPSSKVISVAVTPCSEVKSKGDNNTAASDAATASNATPLDVVIKEEINSDVEDEFLPSTSQSSTSTTVVKEEPTDDPPPGPHATASPASTSNNTLKCLTCSFQCTNRFDLNSHLRDHLRGPFRCQYCTEAFTQKFQLTQHQITAHGVSGMYPCTHCEQIFNCGEYLAAHMRFHAVKPKKKASARSLFPISKSRTPACPKSPPKEEESVPEQDVEEIEFKEEPDGPVIAVIRPEDHYEEMMQAVRSYEAELSQQQQNQNSNSSSSSSSSAEHQHQPSLIKCPECEKVFSKQYRFNRHYRNVHAERTFACEICHKVFAQRCNLTIHQLCHTKEKHYQCEICLKRFPTNGNLTKHKLTHDEVKPFACETCGKMFAQRCNLLKHQVVHKTLRIYQCRICEEDFTQLTAYKKHIHAAHRGEPIQCRICQKTFTTRGNLTKHLVVHQGDKPYECQPCGVAFLKKFNLKRHIQSDAHRLRMLGEEAEIEEEDVVELVDEDEEEI